MNAFTQLVEQNLGAARRGMRGRRTDARVVKADGSKPQPSQVDQPAGLGNTPAAQQAHDMYEGIDLTSPVMLNSMYQRYGPAMVHAAVRKHTATALKQAAKHPDLHPRVRVLLHAAAAVRKAFEGGNPIPGGPAEFPNTSPSVTIPARPSHGVAGKPITTFSQTAGAQSRNATLARPNPAAITAFPQTAADASRSAATEPDGEPVGRQWVYNPARGNPVGMPADKSPGGVGDNDQSYNDSRNGRYVGQPQTDDLVHFRTVGDGPVLTAKLVQVTTGHAIGEFNGQKVQFPIGTLSPHRVGGSDHASDGSTPGGLTATRAGSGVGVGAKNDESEFKPTAGGSNVKKSQRDAIYAGGQETSAPTGAQSGIQVKSPDDGAVLTPYNAQHPYSPEEGAQSGAAPGNHVQGGLTARERALIERVVSHRGPLPTESAALKALAGGAASDDQKQVLKRALSAHGFAVPASRAAARTIAEKL